MRCESCCVTNLLLIYYCGSRCLLNERLDSVLSVEFTSQHRSYVRCIYVTCRHYVKAGGGGGDLAVGSAELSSGAQLTLVPKSSSRALTLEWREAPPPTPESPNEAASPPQRKSFWSRLGGNSATNSNNESSSSSKAPPPPSNASSSSSGKTFLYQPLQV